MEQIQHKYITVQGLKLHVADIGTGPNVIVFLDGFPEIWYSWRHQMIGLAHSGFRAIAPDYRRHGLSDPPSQPDKASYHDLISVLFGILVSLAIPKAEADFGRFDAKTVVWNIYILFSRSEIPIAAENQERWIHLTLFPLGSPRKILRHMELCMRNRASKLHCTFRIGNTFDL
ncbi:epoxide hydrolase 4-like [Pyrus ussuriensis x Pyrus communis]|uniref:Epoxide hydrolase 4-like n=1 Tax=Pyrus ussuriensis x Pyrus communis TaxID=2448454 RepID=A0A5N5IE71_9ROSA|nr:epoxide hydrolase 4-like [Pyrus ussuriensis x Pyrus communis]